MTDPIPAKRKSLEEAIEIIRKIGNDDYISRGKIEFYIQGLKKQIENNPTSIGLNRVIFVTKDRYLNQFLCMEDPSLYLEQVVFQSQYKIDEFCKKSGPGIFVLFGQAGTGKSIALQLKFIETVYEWEFEKKSPIPIFVNMAD